MEKWSYVKIQDHYIAPVSGPLKTADLEGVWVRTDVPQRGIARVTVEVVEGSLQARLLEVDGPSLLDWGLIPVDTLYAAAPDGRVVAGFRGIAEQPSRVIDLHANLSKGLLIIASLAASRSGEGQVGEFAREFYRRVQGAQFLPAPGYRSERSPHAAAGPPSASSFLGVWRNTNPRTRGLSEVSFASRGANLLLRVVGVGEDGPLDWEDTQVELFVSYDDATEPTKIKAAYDFGFMDVLLHAWIKQGVLVMVIFNRFKDGSGRSNYVDREFYYLDGLTSRANADLPGTPDRLPQTGGITR
jgi:hypothetical protein